MPIQPTRLRRSEYARASVLCAVVLAVALFHHGGLSATETTSVDLFYVLLRNGEVLRGTLERDGDHYMIRRDESAELRIPYKDISHVGPTMQALYEHKANRIIEFRADEHLHLASWCLQNNLEPQATHHILRAETIDPFHPHLSLMKARLERFLALGEDAESPANEIALMAAVGQEPIPITRAPLVEEEAAVGDLPPASTATVPTSTAESSAPALSDAPSSQAESTAQETERPPQTPSPTLPNIDPPELISDATVAGLANEVELPELIPPGSAPPAIPAMSINQELIRQVEEKLSDATPNAPTRRAEPNKLVTQDLQRDAQPIESKPRPNSPARSPAVDPTVPVPALNSTAEPNVSSTQKSPHGISNNAAGEHRSHRDGNPGEGHVIESATSPSAIVGHPPPTESPTESLAERPRPDAADQAVAADRVASDVPDVALPPELIRAYVANIQPMLLTRCAAANCHGHATDSEFRLYRVSDRRPSRVMTMRNLANTLEQLDKADPADSPLFTWGQTVHGQTHSKLLVISNVDQQKLLLDWLQDVARPPAEPKHLPIELVDRQRVFAEGAERISLRKIKQSEIRWQKPAQRTKHRWQSAEPADRESTDVQFLAKPNATSADTR